MPDVPIVLPVALEPGASMPSYSSAGAAGMDIRCLEPVTLNPMERAAVRTGVRLAIPEGYEVQVRPRSGLAIKHGVALVNAPGTIDSDYRGEVQIILINLGTETVQFDSGDRIAQLVLCPVTRAHLTRVQTLDHTARGESGFGSTGRK